MSERGRPTDSSLAVTLAALKEAQMEISVGDSWVGKVSELAMEIVKVAQVADSELFHHVQAEGRGPTRKANDQIDQTRPGDSFIFRPLSHTSSLKRNHEAFHELVCDTCSLAFSLPARCKELTSEHDYAKLSHLLVAHPRALQLTLQEIKTFAQLRADRAIWKSYLSAEPDFDRIRGFKGRLRQVLDLLAQVRLDAPELKTVEPIDPRNKTPDDLRIGSDDALTAEPYTTLISSPCPRVPTSASLSCDGSMSQPVGTLNVNTGDPMRVETTDDLRRILSTSSGVDVLLTLEEEPAITRAIDLIQMQVRSARLHSNLSGYLKDCAVCLEALVTKHHALPASLLIDDVTKEGTQPCNGGGFSDIWKGSYGTQDVCLKVLRLHAQGRQQDKDKLIKAFHKEALVWAQLSHPNLLPLIGVNITLFPQGFCLVSPWMTNGDINRFLEKNSDHDRLTAITEISAGMTYLHDSAIVHGDIKGANVLVDEQGHCRLADFGLAITVSESTPLVQSSTSETKGSIRWMAPELFRFSGVEDGNERISKFGRDLYAFACTILEIITGKPPFADCMPSDVMVILEVGTRKSRPPRPSTEIYWCPDNVWALVQRCWVQESRDRPKASEVYGFLSRLRPPNTQLSNLRNMSGRRRATRLGDPCLTVVLATLKETMEVSAVESWVGKTSALAVEIASTAQIADPGPGAQAVESLFAPVSAFRTLLGALKPNKEAFYELVYDTCSLASTLAVLCKALDPENDSAKLSSLTAHLRALQRTLQEIKIFTQRRADRAIWKLYLSAGSDFVSIQGYRRRLREALNVLTRAQSNIAALEAIDKDPRAEIQDGSDNPSCQSMDCLPYSVSNTQSHSSPPSTHGAGLSAPTSPSYDGSTGQSARTGDVYMTNPLRIETVDDLRRILSTDSAVNTLLALKEIPLVVRTVDLLQLEIRLARSDPNLSAYLKRCAICLEVLVNKHHTLPASLFVNDVAKEGTQPCNWGGYSDIWKGTQGAQTVCLKVLRVHVQGRQRKEDKLVKASHKEALLWTRLSHPNLLPFIGVNTTLFPQGFCLVSPWMKNGDIIGYLESNPGHDRLVAILEISAGMAYLHECEIVHGDIKGANVLVNEAGQCLLADFGLAITVAESTPLVNSSTSEMKGSIRWMAPELFRPSNGVRATTGGGKEGSNKFPRDLYAFACTVLEIITGKPPFASLTDPTVMYEVMVNNARPPRPPEIFWCPNNVWALVQRCWAQRSQDRPKANEVHGYLSELVNLRSSGARWEDVFL
ncbi:hypothetical protein PQX77_018412 [Marasmius sp. AFHP31]|nr:hypothetical protein PQX77_018412 [Marasmius sp. AFHP31]